MIRKVWQTTRDHLFPAICYACGEEGHNWCLPEDGVAAWPLCFQCRRNYHPVARQPGCEASLPLLWIGPYHDPQLRLALADWKYRGYWAISENWALDLVNQLRQIGPANPLLVPIPLHWRRQLTRSYNQAAVLSQQMSRASGWPDQHLLLRRKVTAAQAKLSDAERAANVAEAFDLLAMPDETKTTVWLVDDVVTTGATVAAAASVLAAGGWQIGGVMAIAVARTAGSDH